MVPLAMPVTAIVALLTVAMAVLALLQVPPAVRSPSVVDDPAQTELMPVIPMGCVLTV